MELLVFAHRGEAQTFIKEMDLELKNESMAFYHNKSKSHGLLISGEGLFEVMAKLPFIIASYNINSIINLGVAGALNQKLQLGEVFPIRTIYSFLETKPQFKSYTTSLDKAELDCISAIDRVIDTKLSEILSNFADIVDREAWSIGRVCKTHKIPFKCFKLISDYAKDGTECLSIKERALEFSDQMYTFYTNLNETSKKETFSFNLDEIAASFTQKKRITKLLHLLQSKYPQKHYQEYFSESGLDLTSKKNVNNLCEFLEQKLNAKEASLFTQIEKSLLPFNSIGALARIDHKKENSDFTLQMKINSEANVEKLKDALEKFDYKTYQKLWDGHV